MFGVIMGWLLLATIFLSLPIMVINQIDKESFGPYSTDWEKFVTCKGPKKGECGHVSLENTRNMSDVIFVMDLTKDCPITKARVTMSSKQSNKGANQLVNYSLDSPCQHFVLGPILMESFNLTNNCKINKGSYRIHLNMNKKTEMFLGSSFFYGNYGFKVIAYNKNNNFFCTDGLLKLEKKKI